jgi:GT2 family glycosyltransferase
MMNSTEHSLEPLAQVAVIICTRHRPPMTRDVVLSALATRPPPSLIIIVDQADPGSPDPLSEFDGLSNVVRINHCGTGLSRARNLGAAAAEAAGAAIVAFTDDDCLIDPGWLAGFTSAFARADDIRLVFGTTMAARHDPEKGTIPAYVVLNESIHRGVAAKPRAEGMGACMALRVDTWRLLGGFDDRLGAGTPLASAEENDLSLRLLCAGFAVAETAAAQVTHHGFRGREAAALHMAGYMRGSGAATGKMLWLGGFAGIRALAAIGKRCLAGGSGIQMGHLPPLRIRLSNFLFGFVWGLKAKIDSDTGRFLPFNGPGDLFNGGKGSH